MANNPADAPNSGAARAPNTGGGAAPNPGPRPPRGRAHRFARWAFDASTRVAGKTLRVGGKVGLLAAAVGAAAHLNEAAQVEAFFGVPGDGEEEKGASKTTGGKGTAPSLAGGKKRVLVLPFDNLKVVERRRGGGWQDLQPLLQGGGGSKQPTIAVECKELVQAIHAAANDPNISTLYADFGRRVHREPNVKHDPVFALTRNGDPKPSYAFGHSFGMNEYFLASAFSYVHLQARGNLSLFGVASSNVFLKGLLTKYGIKAHIFRHGEYKNAASIFLDKKYSRTHLETVKSTTASLNDTICTGIEAARALKFDNVMWRSIFDYGSLSADNAAEIGLVDATPPVDPLLSMLKCNESVKRDAEDGNDGGSEDIEKRYKAYRSDVAKAAQRQAEITTQLLDEIKKGGEAKKEMEKKKAAFRNHFGNHESFAKFPAMEMVPLATYRQMLNKKANVERRRREFKDWMQWLGERSTATALILVALGFRPDARRDKIAVVTVDGNINSSLSYEVVQALRKVRKDEDVRAVVLRVNSPGGSVVSSEAMLEEIKLFGKLERPVICSMANAAASGGYYIAMNSTKIFALPTTLTGSIGVFGGKFDVSKWADSYGIHGDRYPRDSHATAMDPLTPLTAKMKGNIARQILEIYDFFKQTVATGRSMSVDEVEKVAQGRVWTGEQAKEVGLVDALGGLDRAIAYARTAHTQTPEVAVEYYPKRPDPLEALQKQLSQGVSVWDALLASAIGADESHNSASIEQLLSELSDLRFAEKPHYMMTMDEETALNIILRGE
ncbi:hypothetical protein ACHAXT_001276 [Thalassiosira profunda]